VDESYDWRFVCIHSQRDSPLQFLSGNFCGTSYASFFENLPTDHFARPLEHRCGSCNALVGSEGVNAGTIFLFDGHAGNSTAILVVPIGRFESLTCAGNLLVCAQLSHWPRPAEAALFSGNGGRTMNRFQYLGLLAVVCFGLVGVATVSSNAQKIAPANPPRVAFGGAGADIMHMGPFVQIKGEEEVPVLSSSQSAMFRFFNDGEQAVRIYGGVGMKSELARIESGKFQFVGDTNLKIVGTEKDKVTTVYVVYQK